MPEIPLDRVIAKCDHLFNSGKTAEVGSHLRYWLNEAKMLGDRRGELTVLSELMGHYRMSNDPDKGLAVIADGIKLLDELQLGECVSGGTILINAATALHSFGKYDEAEKLYFRAYRAYTLNLPENDVRFAGLFNNMASVYAVKGDIDTAEAYYLAALEILNDSGSPMDRAVSWINLAQLGKDTENCCEKAMAIFHDPAVPHDGYYAHTCLKCVPALRELGKADHAAILTELAGKVYESD